MEQIELLADRVFVAVKAHIATSVGAITKRLDEFEQRLREVPAGKDGAPGKDGIDGKDADGDAIMRSLGHQLNNAIAAIPIPKNGETGEKGLPGDRGERGEQGERGESGEKGDPGRDGTDGVIGATGERGEKGDTGATGERGEVGEKGDIGERGADGLNAKDGAPGERGERGEKGESGLDGLPGKNGQDGQQGQDGEKGAPGRDALQLDVLSAIDQAKAYPRGTFAKHRGGLVRAVRNTDQLKDGALEQAGWEVILEGVAEVGVEQGEDFRSFAIGIELTSGKASATKFTMPALIHRGVFKAGTDYVRGDAVTWDGSLWHCEHSTNAEPGNGTDWRLCVKRGSPGRDGKDGEKGASGPSGRAGKDLTQLGTNGAKW